MVGSVTSVRATRCFVISLASGERHVRGTAFTGIVRVGDVLTGPTVLSQIREDRTSAHMIGDFGPPGEVEALLVRPNRRDREAAGSSRKARLPHTPNPYDGAHLHLGRCNAFPKSLHPPKTNHIQSRFFATNQNRLTGGDKFIGRLE
jgi:hypothetical protein